jgi:hypothetical protein
LTSMPKGGKREALSFLSDPEARSPDFLDRDT